MNQEKVQEDGTRQNFVLLFGTKSRTGAEIDTKIIKSMEETLLQSYEKRSFTVVIPQLFSILQNPNFEVVSGSMV